ncbi:heavy-metal-associated domain-containing protein [Flavobacterium phycosphaerae]|uniref:heavy-metal-associated domain-containing protein n=1 Tax=Flavobacterium phycosphaerae TaxID=2697515 RepID=UPI001389516E|nr:heavy-metal-associated domain-containing protein [Flavobacterium phycosphaerae]
MKNIILGMMLLFVALSTQAQEKKNKNAKYQFEVNGNCEQCQKRIQKAAYSVPGVKSATWDIESHNLTVFLNEEKCSVSDVKKAIAKVGHDTDDTKAEDTVYEKLHSCCKYERK